MFKYLLFFLLPMVFLSSSCEDEMTPEETTTDLKINVLANFGGEPLELTNQLYEYSDEMGFDLRISKFDFYVSDLALIEADANTELELKDIDLWNFTAATLDRSYEAVPTGKYNTLKLSIGVPRDENAQFCNTCATTHPLADAGHFWQNWSSYIFMKLEGQLDVNGDGITDDAGIVYHSGTDALYQTITLPINLDLQPGAAGTVELDIDIKELFKELDGSMIDLAETPATHTDQQLTKTATVMNNWATALTVR